MPLYAILGVSKQKGGSVTNSGRHNDRARETPNADASRTHLNRVLHGDARNVRQLVTEVIREHGGKPRKDSVEAIELLCKASPAFFTEKDPEKFREKVDRFCECAMAFLRDNRSGGVLVKAVLHLDERTPHVHAHKVPVDPAGNLNARHYLGGREKMEAMHDLYAEYMAPLGLERGRRRSRATHRELQDFYRSLGEEVRLEVEHGQVPDPPKVMITEEARRRYKEKVTRAVLKQLERPHEVMRNQAMLARDERAHREEAERRAEAAEREAAGRIRAVERAAAEKVREAERSAAERVEEVERTAGAVLGENSKLREAARALLGERNQLMEALRETARERQEYQLRARDYQERLSDIPMPEVMERLGYEGERHGEFHVYRGERNEAAMIIERQKAFDHRREIICKNSLDLVVHMRRHNEGVEGFTHTHALEWLRDEFGDRRAAGAAVAHREQAVLEVFDRSREERERERALVHERSDGQERGAQGRDENQDRDYQDRGGAPERGGYEFDR